MSNRPTGDPKVWSPDEINKIREELYSKAAANGLEKGAIDEILALPPTRLMGALRGLVNALGPLSTFSVADHPSQPDSILHDGDALLEDALTALNEYNKLIEDKLAKFSIQTARSLAVLEESATSEQTLNALGERTVDVKQQKLHHAQQIDMLRRSLKSYDEGQLQKLEEHHALYSSDAPFLNLHGTSFDRGHQSGSEPLGTGIWSEHDSALEHIQRWRRMVDIKSPGGQQTLDGAQEHVNQLVMSITHQCQVQLATIFHENQAGDIGNSAHHKAVRDEAAGIIKEIDWLWEEVIPVAHMTVSAQFLKPVEKRFQNWETSKNFREATVTRYAYGVLRFMNDRLSAVAERTQMLVHHHQTFHNAAWVRQSKEASSSENMAPRETSRAPAQGNQLERQSRTASERLNAFMQIYGAAPVNSDQPFANPTPSLLDEHVKSRAEKGDTLLKDLHKSFEAATKAGLTEREISGDLLLESLLTDSSASPAQPGSIYKDAQLENSIEMLLGQTTQIQEMFKSLKLDGPAQAPDYVEHAYRQTSDRLAGKGDERGPKGVENPSPSCSDKIRGPKFDEFVRKWGH
ncbi:hypothetical protein GGR50DRAFT_688307 [Xylaria sp. CBS 124048]|nr:hypothetical protein GGR50DRAFT_688307 [Xylaria sp. CBS 124048]